jgi:sialidase-1
VVFLAFLVLLVVFFLVEKESVHIMIPVAGGMLALAAGFASRKGAAPGLGAGWMPKRTAGVILLLGLVGMGAWFASNQQPRVDGTPLTPVFVNGQEGYACFRIPSIVRAVDGALLAFAEGRRDNCGDFGGVIRVVLKRSTDDGRSWSALQVVGENGEAVAASPSPVVDEQTGAVILIFNKTRFNEFDVAAGKGVRQFFVTRSPDNGLTWSEPQDISSQVMRLDQDWREAVPAVGHAIQLRSGRLFYSALVTVGDNSVNNSQNFVFWSDDHGATWTIGGLNPVLGYNESMAVEMENGSVMVNARSYGKGIPTGLRAVMVYPFDAQGNISMAPGSLDPQLVTPTVASSIIRYGWATDGNGFLLFSGPDHPRLRVNMTVRLSRDDGKTWPMARTIDPGPSAYSDMAVQGDGMIGLLYERGNEGGIYYTSFSFGWLEK